MAIRVRKIAAGGSATLPPCWLAAVEGDGVAQGKITDKWGRKFDSPPSGVADFGAGTAPMIAGTVTASTNTLAYFNFL